MLAIVLDKYIESQILCHQFTTANNYNISITYSLVLMLMNI